MSVPVCLLSLALLAAAVPPVQRLLESVPADSLVRPLTRLEAGRNRAGAEAATTLGYLHYARGEYRQAAEAFARATPRSDAAARLELRYWSGLAWLGAGEPATARGAFEDAARADSPRRAEALLGVAWCWEAAGHPERALETLETLLAGEPGESGPAALERLAAVAVALHRPELARRARERLLHDYPRSVEAMRAGPAGTPHRAGARS